MTNRIQHVELETRPIDPNRAKYYAWGLAAVAALFAVVTIKSNYDYFDAYYKGWAFYLRVIPFLAIEATIIGLTLTKGWGNPRQMAAALVFEALLVFVCLAHTYFVSGATQARISAERSKAAAKVDFSATTDAATKAAEANTRAQAEYNKALNAWRRAAADAKYLRQPIPPQPEPPHYLNVPQLSQETVATASSDVEGKVEAEVPHTFLLGILFVMIGLVIAAWTTIVFLADGSRLRYWLLQQRATHLDAQMGSAKRVRTLGEKSELDEFPKTIDTAPKS